MDLGLAADLISSYHSGPAVGQVIGILEFEFKFKLHRPYVPSVPRVLSYTDSEFIYRPTADTELTKSMSIRKLSGRSSKGEEGGKSIVIYDLIKILPKLLPSSVQYPLYRYDTV